MKCNRCGCEKVVLLYRPRFSQFHLDSTPEKHRRGDLAWCSHCKRLWEHRPERPTNQSRSIRMTVMRPDNHRRNSGAYRWCMWQAEIAKERMRRGLTGEPPGGWPWKRAETLIMETAAREMQPQPGNWRRVSPPDELSRRGKRGWTTIEEQEQQKAVEPAEPVKVTLDTIEAESPFGDYIDSRTRRRRSE